MITAKIATVTPIRPLKRKGRPTAIATILADSEVVTIPETPNLVDYTYIAWRNKPAAIFGSIFGACVPLWITNIVHSLDLATLLSKQCTIKMWFGVLLTIVGLCYSITAVSAIIRQTGKTDAEALTYTLLTEGAMIAAPAWWARDVALVLLCACNALSMATALTKGSRELAFARLRARATAPTAPNA